MEEKIVPIVPIREGVVFPHIEAVLTFGRSRSIAAAEAAFKSDHQVIFASQKDPIKNDPEEKSLYGVGTLGTVERILRSDSELNAWVKGIARVKILSIEATEPFLIGRVEILTEVEEETDEVRALMNNLTKKFREAVGLGKSVDVMSVMRLLGENSPSELVDQVAFVLELKTAEKQKLLETLSIRERVLMTTEFLLREMKVLELERKIISKSQKHFDQNMRESVLRERKRIIEQELGEVGDAESEAEGLAKKIKKTLMPKEIKKKAQQELKRLKLMSPNNPETGYVRTYLEWLVEMPWSISTPNNILLNSAVKILNEDHYGLEKVKERIIEYLAVMRLKKKKKQTANNEGPTILCFIGPPGVGKTSIGRSIARALGRKFVRISLGGIRDEAEIRGHRRTYVGALPGRIIQGIKTAGSNNPVFMLDEIDKVGADFRGDPSSALLEALDSEQNKEFSDHYLDVPFDLSKVMFITTGNLLETIPAALRDRMEIIRFSGYTEEEKYFIAKKYLWSKQLRVNGLENVRLTISREALLGVIRYYTREAGVRELERNLATLTRKVARKVAEGKKTKDRIERKDLTRFLGPRKFLSTLAEKKDEVGMATGLAYTEAGGDILFIETVLMPGSGNLLLTGKLGEVMKESGKAAVSFVRSHWRELGLKPDFYKKIDIHVHVPEGAVPKDGPSAGIGLATSLVSALTKRKVRRDLGMTGEVTLRGKVLEIGGVKEKIIAAHRAGLTKLVLPKDNRKDLVEVPEKVKKEMKFYFVEGLKEVLDLALLPVKEGRNGRY
ncbi:MAG: endopeptidase La [Candidatus Shapirobacteria bacterium]